MFITGLHRLTMIARKLILTAGMRYFKVYHARVLHQEVDKNERQQRARRLLDILCKCENEPHADSLQTSTIMTAQKKT